MKKERLTDLGKYRDFLFPGMAIVLILFSFLVILKPRLTDLFQLRRDLGKQKEELARLSQKVAVLEGYDQNELQIRSEQVLKVLPTEKDAPFVLATVRGLTSRHNLELESLTIEVGEISTESAQTKTKEKALPSLDLQLSVAGSLNDFYDFLSALESTTPIMRINQVDFSRQGTTVEDQIQLSSYYLMVPKTIGKTDRQIIPLTSKEETIYQELSQYKSAPTGETLPLVGSGKENPFAF